MALSSQYIVAPSLQELFRDKDTGLPLRNGVAYFYSDNARTVPKDIYKLTSVGIPPNYSYVDIGNVINLTAIGTFSDNQNPANDIVPYFKPYDANGNIELYYVAVYSEGGIMTGVLQFTREAWPPNVIASGTANQDLNNYIPNGQFRIHNDIPADATHVAGEIRAASTTLAQGGWTFDRPNGSMAKDIVTFENFGSYVPNPSASPRFRIRIENQIPSAGDGYKDLRIKFDDVNKFASAVDQFTFAFAAEVNAGTSLSVSLILIKNYGMGGSPTDEIPLGNLTITNSYTIIQKSGFVFESNAGKTIGANNDDYLQLAIRFPTDSVFDVSLTDFILTDGNTIVTGFPQTPDAAFRTNAIAGWMPTPNPNGSQLYLPLKLTPQGLTFDDSEVGDVVPESQNSVYINSLHPTSNRMLADGNQYETTGYSPLGIPYSRLQAKYWDDTLGLPIYGTGANYFTGVFTAASAQLRITNNSAGIVTDASQGGVSTTFTIATAYKSINPTTGYFCSAVQNSTSSFLIINSQVTDVADPTVGTANVSVSTIRSGTSLYPKIIQVTVLAGGVTASTYFTFDTYNSADLGWYVWFKVDGSGTDPAVGGRTGILVNLISGDTVSIIAQKIREAINNWQITTVITVAASAVPAGSYFNIDSAGSPGVAYYVWYKKDGAGTDPAPSNRTAILVEILSADTAVQVAQKTQIAINKKFFASADFRDYFLRGLSNGATLDPDRATRYSLVPGVIGDRLGTTELDSFATHIHAFTYQYPDNPPSQAGGGATIGTQGGPHNVTTTTGLTGGSETRPINKNVNFAIIY